MNRGVRFWRSSVTCSASDESAHTSGVAHTSLSSTGTRYLSLGVLLLARYSGGKYTLVAVNTSDTDHTVPFRFPIGGDYAEELHGSELGLKPGALLQKTWLPIPSHYGRIWTAVSH
jgi:hypothetical protein